ncbi:17831_t:CDS:1, partial [Racocetra fulgida]
PDDFSLDGLESDGNEDNEYPLQSSTLSQTGNQPLIKKWKKIKRTGGSSVKIFYNTAVINNTEYSVCCYKICIQQIKYVKDGSTLNLWRHLRNKHHISRAIVEDGRIKVVKNNNKYEFVVMPESSQSAITQTLNKIKKYSSNNLKQKNLDNNIVAFIVEELQPFLIIYSRAFKRIIEELDIQANILNNDCLKDILINSEDKVLRNLREYVNDSAEI